MSEYEDSASYLTFRTVSRANKERIGHWHKSLEEWTPNDWATAFMGEAGELCNVLKKIRRLEGGAERVGRGTKEELMKAAAIEIGDAYIYLDLLAQRLGFHIENCIVDTFNRVSIREGLPDRLQRL